MSAEIQEKINSLYNATVKSVETVASGLFIIRVLPDSGVNDFQAGQYVAIGLVDEKTLERPKPRVLKRAYSIGSSPHTKDYIEFYIAEVVDGALTPRLAKLKAEDRLFVAPKITGTFTISDVPSGKNIVLVSTGTGIAPYLSMIRSPETWDAVSSITIIHGVRYKKDLGYREELEELAAKDNSKLKYFPLTSRDEPEGNIRKGYAQSIFIDGKVDLNPEVDHVFACGNPAMINDLQEYLTNEKGYVVHSRKQAGNLHLEKYW